MISSSSAISSSRQQQQRVAIVTGSNKGIGYFIALQLGLSGLFSNIILACRDPTLGLAAVDKMTREFIDDSVTTTTTTTTTKTEFKFLPLTVGDEASHDNFCQMIEKEYGKVDVLVNNAGFAYKGSDPTPFKGQTKKTLQINYFGLVDFTEKMIPLLRKGNDPRLVNVASMAGRLGQVSKERQEQFTDENLTIPQLNQLMEQFEQDVQKGIHKQQGWSNTNYGMSKLGVIAATRIWARQEDPSIKVNCCCPGYCATDMSSHMGTRSPSDGAKNAVIPATMENPPSGAFFRDYQVSTW